MNQMHSSPFKSNFNQYLGNFTLLKNKYVYQSIDPACLEGCKPLYYDNHVVNFDFHAYQRQCDVICGQITASSGSTSVSVICKAEIDGNLRNIPNRAIHLVKTEPKHYVADIYFTANGVSHGDVTCVRLIRENKALTAYVVTNDIYYQFIYCNAFVGGEIGNVYLLRKTKRFVNDPGYNACIIGDTTMVVALKAFMNHYLSFIGDPSTVPEEKFPQEHQAEASRLRYTLVSAYNSEQSRLRKEVVSKELENSLLSYYTIFGNKDKNVNIADALRRAENVLKAAEFNPKFYR